MKNRLKTIQALQRLAERPGTPAEGEVARAMLAKLGAISKPPFRIEEWPVGTIVYYTYWTYRNARGVIVDTSLYIANGQRWVRLRFDHLKRPRWVPVTSAWGTHLFTSPLPEDEARRVECASVGIDYDEQQEWVSKAIKIAAAAIANQYRK